MPARVKTVQRAQKDQGTCEKCAVRLPKGSAYRWFKVGFRSTVKRKRCMASACTPEPRELDASQMGEVRQAQQDAHGEIDSWEPADVDGAYTTEDLENELAAAAERAGEVKDQYEETVSEHPMLEGSLQDKIDALDSWIIELESWSGDEWDDPAAEEGWAGTEDERTEHRDAWAEEQRQSARDVLDSLEA